MNTLKYIKKGMLFSALALFSVSCTDEILKEESSVNPTVDGYFQEYNDLDEVVTASYRQMVQGAWTTGLGGARSRTIFTGADDWTSQPSGNKTDFKEGDQLNISSSNTGISDTGWGMPYNVIQQANFAISGQQILISNGLSENDINPKAAEAYALRAWAYFRLVRLYGGLPLVLDYRYSPSTSSLSRSSVSEVYTQILSDLEFAITHLPESQSEKGRINKWAAKALRSKVYLTMAGWPLKQTENYAKALTDAQDVIENGPYAFEERFSDIFDSENEDTNTEYIWQLKFCNNVDCPSAGLITPFASQTTKPSELGGFQDIFIEKAFYNKYPEGDRKEYTFLSQLISQNGSILTWENFTWKHPFLSKFYSGTVDKYEPYEPNRGTTAPFSDLDMPLFRITEIMLIYAEAHIMGGGGNATTALDYLNRVKRRGKGVDVGTPDTDDLSAFTQQDVIDERGWEFVGEMKRWFDLIRTETLADALSDRDEPDNMALIGDPSNTNYYYLPIPDLDIEANPNIEQNPR